jgi:PAS domain S-box-containing protein
MEMKSYTELVAENGLLQSKNEKLNFIIENSVDVIYELDKSLKFVYISPSLYDNMGYNQDEWIGHRISEFTTWLEFIKMAREALSAIRNYKTFKQTMFETVFIHKNGNPIHFEIIGKVMFNKIGLPIGVMGSTRNITTRKKTEQNLRESESKLKEINASKDKFFSIIAHDLKSPFNSMLGLSDLLLNEFENYPKDKQLSFIELINSKIKSTYNLLENLLIWSQSERGLISFHPEPINLNQISSEVISLLSVPISDKSIKVINDIPKDFIIIGDSNILSTVLRNLLSNSVKFTNKNGVITFRSNFISDKYKNTFVEILVIDNGIGIPKEKIQELFSLTESKSSLGTENELGSGLGLNLCKELLDIHKGKICVESEVGKGSSFIVTIPVKQRVEK